MMAIREPAVSGSFYPADASTLKDYCQTHLKPVSNLIAAKAVILPHAGYVYSGKTACLVLSRVKIPEVVFLIGPNHHGWGPPFALADKGEWETPLGNVAIHQELATGLMKNCPGIEADLNAHRDEHSLEVEVPLLQARNPQIKIVPLIVGTFDLKEAHEVACACGRYLAECGKELMVVISSDMSHYESDHETRMKDQHALDAILSLDAEGLERAVKTYKITMCGFLPAYMLLIMKDYLGIRKATLVDYRTSGDVSGDYNRVVGYAGFIFE